MIVLNLLVLYINIFSIYKSNYIIYIILIIDINSVKPIKPLRIECQITIVNIYIINKQRYRILEATV